LRISPEFRFLSAEYPGNKGSLPSSSFNSRLNGTFSDSSHSLEKMFLTSISCHPNCHKLTSLRVVIWYLAMIISTFLPISSRLCWATLKRNLFVLYRVVSLFFISLEGPIITKMELNPHLESLRILEPLIVPVWCQNEGTASLSCLQNEVFSFFMSQFNMNRKFDKYFQFCPAHLSLLSLPNNLDVFSPIFAPNDLALYFCPCLQCRLELKLSMSAIMNHELLNVSTSGLYCCEFFLNCGFIRLTFCKRFRSEIFR
jgi:hypothetical protein